MSYTSFAFLGYISWTLILLIMLAIYRTARAQSSESASLKFAPDGRDVEGFGERLTRAQANCAESFVFIGGILLYSLATGNMVITDGLALVLLVARVVQSCIHLVSTSNMAIQIRFVFFLVQVGLVIYWIYRFLLV